MIMNTFEKIKRSWWVIISFIPFLNGLGFAYISLRHNNRNWLLEGVIYELPWLLYFIYFAKFGDPNIDFFSPSSLILVLAFTLYFVSIVRSFWVAFKLADVYDNGEKYRIQTTNLTKTSTPDANGNGKTNAGCCLCIIVLFILFLILAL